MTRRGRPGGRRHADDEKLTGVQLWYIIIGAVFGSLFMYALANRPEASALKAQVEASLADYRRTHPDAPRPQAHADDWLLAAAYTAKVDGAGEFRCFGAAHVSVCTSPDDRR